MTIAHFKAQVEYYRLISLYNSESFFVWDALLQDLNSDHSNEWVIREAKEAIAKLQSLGLNKSANLLQALVEQLQRIEAEFMASKQAELGNQYEQPMD